METIQIAPPVSPVLHSNPIHSSACSCGHHVQTEWTLKSHLFCAMGGGSCLLFSILLPLWKKTQPEIISTWALMGAILAALPIFLRGFYGLFVRRIEASEFYTNQFMCLAVVACLISRQYLTAGTIAIVLLIGHLLENRTLRGTEEAIQSLLKFSKIRTRRIVSGKEEEINAHQLLKGDIIRVLPGDIIPADGVILSGKTTVNQSSITGEYLPAESSVGDSVFAGASNLTGMLEVEVTTIGKDTVLGRVTEIVQEAQQSRAPIMRITETYAQHYMPFVLLIAGFVLFFTHDIQRAISILIVSVPCTFILASPSAMVAALAAASRMGILIKSVRFLEVADEVDTVVFDKTGTLTTAELQVIAIHNKKYFNQDQILLFAASIGQHSTHPITRALVRAAKTTNAILLSAENIEEKHGLGIRGYIESKQTVVGRKEWLIEQGIFDIPEDYNNIEESSIVLVGIEGIFAGWIALGDTLREESSAAVARLRALGVENIVLLTGDRASAALPVAQQLKIQNISTDCLPQQKMEQVCRLKERGHKVLVIGDGVNDAPALAAGNIGIAMGTMGSDVAIQTADVALMTNDLRRLPDFIDLSRQTLRIVRQNIMWSLFFIGLAILFSALGFVPPIIAAFAHELGVFVVIFNSARILRFEGSNTLQ